jgi:electron transfer flavoprotein alpha subunit
MLSATLFRTTVQVQVQVQVQVARAARHAKNCRLASTLILSDPLTADGAAPPATQSAVSAAVQLDANNTIELLVVGATTPTQVPAGVSKVYHASATQPIAETVASTLASVVNNHNHKYDYVVGTSSKFGATVIPRVAALLGVSPVTDIIQVLQSGELSSLDSC